jgi:hypothetical protein
MSWAGVPKEAAKEGELKLLLHLIQRTGGVHDACNDEPWIECRGSPNLRTLLHSRNNINFIDEKDVL